MNKSFVPVLLLAAVAQGALAQNADEQQFPGLLTQARASCGSNAGATLRWSPELAKVAARVQKGEKAADAIAAEGYRAVRLVRTNAQAPAAAEVTKLVARDNCSALTDARIADVAYVRSGNDWVVLLAAPLSMPQLADRKAVAQRVLALVNEARAQDRSCGADPFRATQPLAWNEKLEQAATAHAKEMAQHSYLSVTGRDDTTPQQRFSGVGYRSGKSSENVAAGIDSPERLVQQWLSEAESCRNLMEPGFTEMAVSYEMNKDSRSYVYWSLELATPLTTKGEARNDGVGEREPPRPERPMGYPTGR